MLKVRSIFLWAALVLFSVAVHSRAQVRATGYIDTSFGAPCLSNASGVFTRALALLPDGRILVGGDFRSPQACANAMGRLRTNGATDATFTSPFLPGNSVNAIAFQSDGKIIVGGLFSDSTSVYAVARLGPNGAMDTSFAHELFGGNLVANAVIVMPDDRLVVAGYEQTGGGRIGFLTRLSRNGLIDQNFQGSTTISSSGQGISAMALQSDKIIMGGSFTSYNDRVQVVARDGIVRLNSSGLLDLSFLPPISNADVRALLLQSDGKILVAGNFTFNGLSDRCLARLNEDGSTDGSFGDSGSVDAHGTRSFALALQSDGKILLGHMFGVARFRTNGTLDTTFGPLNAPNFLGTKADIAAAIVIQPDKRVLVGATNVIAGDGAALTLRRGVARLWGDIPPAPVIIQQPATQQVDSGTNVTFSVIATGAPPLAYQWRKNGTKITGATSSLLTLTNVHSTDSASYTVVVSNDGGAVTSQVARLTVSFNTSPLTIITNGVGAVLPDLTKKPLEIGQTYTITARPAVGNLFSNWTSLDPSVPVPSPSSPTLTFVMRSNLTLVADFVPNPFIPVRGVYNGLFFNAGMPSHSTAGGLMMTLDDKGRVRGSVRMGKRTRKFVAAFSLQQTVQANIPATATDPALALMLQIDIPAASIVGSVLFGTNTSPETASSLAAYRNPFSSKANPATNSGAYNAALVGAMPSPAVPFGDGFMSFSVSTAGRVSGKGNLADGSAIKIVTGQGGDSRLPVYVPLYGGLGSLFGWVTANGGALESAASTLWWIKPAGLGGTFYPAGFSNVVLVNGSQFVKVPAHTPVITLTNGMIFLGGGNLIQPFTNSITIGPDNKIIGDNQLTLTMSPAKGTVTGSFVDPSTNRKRNVKGVALQIQNQLRGFFLGDSEGGRVFAGETPVPAE